MDSNSGLSKDSQFFYTSVYWIDSLKDINNLEKFYWYYNLSAFTLQLNYSKLSIIANFSDSLDNSFFYFSKYYVLFNEANLDCKSYLYSQEDLLTTDIFSNGILMKNKANTKTNYSIFKCSFNTAILKISTPIYLNDGEKIEDFNIFVPISQLKSFEKINFTDAENNSFILSTDKILLR